jgi:prepilin-type N-terminal cleavage/methylation domain-containing protein/prepilin-type processing-associated H-X9-DG protein
MDAFQKSAGDTPASTPSQIAFRYSQSANALGDRVPPICADPPRTAVKAFTLIELLVVVAIIAILLALTMPVLNSMQERGRAAACASNLRQIGTALLAFAGEHDSEFPIAGATIPHGQKDPTTGQPSWTEQLEPYMGPGTAVYVCPSSSRVIPQDKQYSYYMGCHAAFAQNGGFAALRLTLIQKPTSYILAGDSAYSGFAANDADKDDYTQSPAFATSPPTIHRGLVNLVYADGHIESASKLDRTRMSNMYDGSWQDPK